MTIPLHHGIRTRRVLPLYRTCDMCGSAIEREVEKTRCPRCRREVTAARYHADPEGMKAAWREWRNANLEKQRERTRRGMAAWSAANREEHRARSRAWRAANPEKRKAQHHKRRALKLSALGAAYTTDALIAARFDYHGRRCVYCGDAESPLVIDHVMPLARGGAHLPANIVPACVRCNSSKGAKTLAEWAAEVASPV